MADKTIAGLTAPADNVDIAINDQVAASRGGVTNKMTFAGPHVVPAFTGDDIGKTLQVTGNATTGWREPVATSNSFTNLITTAAAVPDYGVGFRRGVSYNNSATLTPFDDICIYYTYPNPGGNTMQQRMAVPVGYVLNARIILQGNKADLEVQVRNTEVLLTAYRRDTTATTTDIPVLTSVQGLSRAT